MKPEDLTLEQKRAANVWDHIDDALTVIELARAGKWSPYENMQCKYVELRIDMRDGGCLIKDKDGNRIDPAQLRKQLSGHMHGNPWPTERPALGGWQLEAVGAASAKPMDCPKCKHSDSWGIPESHKLPCLGCYGKHFEPLNNTPDN